jgi:hypothetical protein
MKKLLTISHWDVQFDKEWIHNGIWWGLYTSILQSRQGVGYSNSRKLIHIPVSVRAGKCNSIMAPRYTYREVLANKPDTITCLLIGVAIPFFIEGPRSRCYRRTAALKAYCATLWRRWWGSFSAFPF